MRRRAFSSATLLAALGTMPTQTCTCFLQSSSPCTSVLNALFIFSLPHRGFADKVGMKFHIPEEVFGYVPARMQPTWLREYNVAA